MENKLFGIEFPLELTEHWLEREFEKDIKERDKVATYLYLSKAIMEDITLKQALEQYELVEKEQLPFDPSYIRGEMRYVIKTNLMLVKRNVPLVIDNSIWETQRVNVVLKLARDLKIEDV